MGTRVHWKRLGQGVLAMATCLAFTIATPAAAATVLTAVNVFAPINGSLGSCPSTIAIGTTCQLSGNAGYASFQIGIQAGSPNILTITQVGDFTIGLGTQLTFTGGNTPFTTATLIDAVGAGTFSSSNIVLDNGTLKVTISKPSASGAVIRIGLGTEPIVTSVPEPTTWAMMLLGFGGIGLAVRRQRTPLSITTMAKALLG